MEDLKWNRRDSQGKSWEIYREIKGKFKGYCNISHFSLILF